jgi:hypothetical protein
MTIIGQAIMGWTVDRVVKIRKAKPTPAARYANCFKVISPTKWNSKFVTFWGMGWA